MSLPLRYSIKPQHAVAYLRAFRAQLPPQVRSRIFRFYMLAALGLVFGLGAMTWATFAESSQMLSPELLVLSYLGIIVFAVAYLLLLFRYRRAYRRALASLLVGEYQLVTTESGIELRSKHRRTSIDWAAIRSVAEADGIVMLGLADGTGSVLIPAEAFPSDAAKAEFKTLIAKKIAEAAHASDSKV